MSSLTHTHPGVCRPQPGALTVRQGGPAVRVWGQVYLMGTDRLPASAHTLTAVYLRLIQNSLVTAHAFPVQPQLFSLCLKVSLGLPHRGFGECPQLTLKHSFGCRHPSTEQLLLPKHQNCFRLKNKVWHRRLRPSCAPVLRSAPPREPGRVARPRLCPGRPRSAARERPPAYSQPARVFEFFPQPL